MCLLKMFRGQLLTWSTLKVLLKAGHQWKQIRPIFSKTGTWPKKLDSSVRKEIEAFWKPRLKQEDRARSNQEDGEKEKFYVLSMFPYPSGRLHMGHVRVYTVSDTMARYYRMKGKQVIHPMGWDAFGLPAENAAIERGERPDKWTYSNIETMKKQLEDLSLSFDWHREFRTCDPEYYRWTQFLFLKMFEAGLVYQKESEVNWDPVDQTVLADEQIDEQGLSWRSGAKVEKRYLRQWYIRATAYAKSLLDGLNDVNPTFWRDIIKMQRHWLGECTGCRLDFRIKDGDSYMEDPLSVFTSVPEGVYGVSHIALSKDHRFNRPEYYKQMLPDKESEVLLTLEAEHPFTKERVPVVVSSTTEFEEHNDSHLGIPSLSEKDRKVAEMFHLPRTHILSEDAQTVVESNQFTGMKREEAFEAVAKFAREEKVGGHLVSPFLKDWLISRQRYWGTPIPIIHCPKCKAVPIPYESLPVELPELPTLTGKGTSPLEQVAGWCNVKCPRCGGAARRETDTMDTFVDSSWYFYRYLDQHNKEEPFSVEKANKYMPVDLYIGGKEHAVLHLYFARFFSHFLCDTGYVKYREPFISLLTQGMVMAKTYMVKDTGRYITQEEVDSTGTVEKETGAPVVVEWEKMSKSKYNGVDPEEVIAEYSVDTTRLCMLFVAAPMSNRKWSNDEFWGVINWQSRVWTLISDFIEQKAGNGEQDSTKTELQKVEKFIFESHNHALRQITFHTGRTYLLHTALAVLFKFTSSLKKVPKGSMSESRQFEEALADLVIMIAPFAPNFASELWTGLSSVVSKSTAHQWDKGVLEQSWPEISPEHMMPLAVQINGRDCGKVEVRKKDFDDLTQTQAQQLAQELEKYNRIMENKIIENTNFEIEPGFAATINVITSLKSSEERQKPKQERRKETKAEMRERKKQQRKKFAEEKKKQNQIL